MRTLVRVLLIIMSINVCIGDADAGIFSESPRGVVSKSMNCDSFDSIGCSDSSDTPVSGDHHNTTDCHSCHLGHCSFTLGHDLASVAPVEVSQRFLSNFDQPALSFNLSGLERPPRI